MTAYQKAKARAREQALEWQSLFDQTNYDWRDISDWCEHFYHLGKRYSLLREFHENSIC